MNDGPFVDSNLWLYALVDKQEDPRHRIAASALRRLDRPVISTQVLAEVMANLLKKTRVPEPVALTKLADLQDACRIVPTDVRAHRRASALRSAAAFSYWDSLIVASALEAGCGELWTEDMHAGLLVEGRLRIVNPLIG